MCEIFIIFQNMLDPFSKVLSHAIQTSIIKYNYLVDVCSLCHRSFTRERDKLSLSRVVVTELMQAIKFKSSIPDTNLLYLLHFVLQVNIYMCAFILLQYNLHKTECRLLLGHRWEIAKHKSRWNSRRRCFAHLQYQCIKLVERTADRSFRFYSRFSQFNKSEGNNLFEFNFFFLHFYSLISYSRIFLQSYGKSLQAGLNEDTLGGTLKCGLAQYLAIEITKGNNRENKSVAKYMPWLYSAPSMIQTG